MTRWTAILIATLVLAIMPAKAGLMECATKSNCDNLVGKRLWIAVPRANPNSVEVTFQRGNWTNTLKLRSGSFLVNAIARGPNTSDQDFVVKLPDGRAGWIGTDSAMFLSTVDPITEAAAVKADCARRGQPKIGMTPAELTETCWGKPRRIVKKTTAAGVEESYVYGVGHVVTLRDGKVAEIVEAR